MNKNNIDYILLIFIFILLIFNIIILWSISEKHIYLVYRTIIHIILSIIIMFISSKISYETYEYFTPLLYIISIFLLILVYLFGNINKGSYRWLKIGFLKFQPSEILKISVPLMISYLIKKYKCPKSLKSLFLFLLVILIPAFLTAIQPDLGTSILIIFSGLIVLFMSGIKYKQIILIGFLMLIISLINWIFFMKNYQKNRILSLFNSNLDPYGIGYHINQSKIAIGSGGLFGKGLFNGTQSKLKFIPENHTDFVFSVIAEELGLIGSLFLLFLYSVFIFRLLLIAINSKKILYKILISSFVLTIFFNIFLNIGMVIGIIPIVGIPLPLISYGGSSLVTIFIKIGIIFSINSVKNNINIKYFN